MEIERTELVGAIKKLASGLGKNDNGLNGTDSIILDEQGLHSYNNSICVTVPIELENVDGAINGAKLNEVVSKFKGDLVTLEKTPNGLLIKCGRNRSTLKWIDDVNTPEFISNLHEIEPNLELPEDFMDALQLCNLGDAKSEFNGVFVNDNTMNATDGNRFSCYTFDEAIESDEDIAVFWLGQLNLNELLKVKDELTHYTVKSKTLDGDIVSGEWIHFKTDGGVIFSCTLTDLINLDACLEGIEGLKELDDKIEIKGVFPPEFKGALSRVSSLSSKNEESQNFITIEFTPDKLILKSNSDYGNSEESMEWPDTIEGLTETISYNYAVDFLVNFYNKADNFSIAKLEVEDEDGIETYHPLILEAGNFKHMVSSI